MQSLFGNKRKLIRLLTLLLSTGFVLTTLASYFVSRNVIRHDIIQNELPLTTDNVYSEIQKDLLPPIFVSSMMARDTFVRDWLLEQERDTEKITRYLKEIREKYGAVTSFLVSEKSRIYYHEGGILKRVSLQDPLDVWYFRARALRELYEINLDADEAHHYALTVFINYRVTDYQGKLLGVTGVGLPMDKLGELIDRYQTRYQRTVYFSDVQGRIVLQGKDGKLQNIHAVSGLQQQADAILKQKATVSEYRRDGRMYQLNVRFLPELGWYLFVEKSEDEALASIRHTLFLNLGICVLISSIVLWLTSVSITRYQNQLKQAVETHTSELNVALNNARTANQIKNQMLAYVSHDLRAPLSAMTHYLEVLDREPREYSAPYQAAIRDSIRYQTELIDELTEYSRGEWVNMQLEPAPTFLYSFLQEMGRQGELLAQTGHNRFTMSLDEKLPAVLVFDSKRVRQVLMNLLSNAAKFTLDGEIQLQTAWNVATQKLHFSVRDTGSGISLEDQARIFQPYQRAETHTTGLGLGLAIATDIAHKMGAHLQVSSQPGATHFWFDLPLSRATEAEVSQPVESFPLPDPIGTGKQVLIVGSDEVLLSYLTEILSLADFDTVRFREGTPLDWSALHVVIVLMDQEDAREVLRLLSRHGSLPPVILYCASPPPHRDELPIAHILFKPISPFRLLDALARLFDSLNFRTQPVASGELTLLHELIRMGQLSEVLDWATQLEHQHPEQSYFARRVRNAAALIDFAELYRLAAGQIQRGIL